MASSVPHLVPRAGVTPAQRQISATCFATMALRIDRLAVDRSRYRGTAGELLLQRMPSEPRALQVDEWIARLRERNTETRLETMRRVMALPAVKR